MSSEALYERYKDALKRGHVASLRGRLEESLTAYAEAAAIAPERATPHASAGTALLRRKRPADALRHYAVALSLAPRDEAALLGRAQALAALDRRPEAADAFDALADVRATGGRLADAVEAARRGLELAEGRERRRTLERLIEQLRASEPGEPGRVALEQALQVLEGSAMQPARLAPVRADPDPDPDAAAVPPAGAPRTDAELDHAPAGDDMGPDEAGDERPDVPQEAIDVEPPVRAALDRDIPAEVDLTGLFQAVDRAIDTGAKGEALEALLDLAAIHRRDGRIDAALDACYLALSLDPDNIGLHLGLVELYDHRGWAGLATDKLDLVDRLATLDEDAVAARRVGAARACRG